MTDTQALIEWLEALDRKATQGPWTCEIEAEPEYDDDPIVYVCHPGTVCDATTIAEMTWSAGQPQEERLENGRAIAALRNALPEIIAALREREGWQPIGTAPKDGTWIMGWAERDSAPYRISWGANHDGRLTWCTAFGSFYDGYITHWTPLPPTGSAAAHAEAR